MRQAQRPEQEPRAAPPHARRPQLTAGLVCRDTQAVAPAFQGHAVSSLPAPTATRKSPASTLTLHLSRGRANSSPAAPSPAPPALDRTASAQVGPRRVSTPPRCPPSLRAAGAPCSAPVPCPAWSALLHSQHVRDRPRHTTPPLLARGQKEGRHANPPGRCRRPLRSAQLPTPQAAQLAPSHREGSEGARICPMA